MTKELEKRIYLKALFIGLIIGITGALLGFYKFSIGIAVGCVVSIINFKLLAVRTNIVTSSKRPPNPLFIIVSYLFRFLIMGAVLWIAINRGMELFVGAAAGLFMATIAIYVDGFLEKATCRFPLSRE